MRTRMLAMGAIVAAASLLGACGGSGEGSSSAAEADGGEQGVEVSLKTFMFDPETLEVESGTTVTWTNEDNILHTVTSGIGQEQGVPGVSKDKEAKPDGMFDQEMDGAGATFEFTFDESGKYLYYCAIHPGMTGTVVVQ